MGKTCRTNVSDQKRIQNFTRKKSEGRYMRKWEDNIKIELSEIRCENVDWINIPPDRIQWRALVNTVVTFRTP
jgi:hypothetical protein